MYDSSENKITLTFKTRSRVEIAHVSPQNSHVCNTLLNSSKLFMPFIKTNSCKRANADERCSFAILCRSPIISASSIMIFFSFLSFVDLRRFFKAECSLTKSLISILRNSASFKAIS